MKKLFNIVLFLSVYISASVATSHHRWADGNSHIAFVDKASTHLSKSIKSKGDEFSKRVYKKIFYVPIWIEEKGLSKSGDELIDIVGNDKTLSRSMDSYKLLKECKRQISALKRNNSEKMGAIISLEMEMTRLYESYAAYRITGGINWRKFHNKLSSLKEKKNIDAQWTVYDPSFSAFSILRKVVSGKSLKTELDRTDQTRFGFSQLRNYLVKYINIRNGGQWKKLKPYRGQVRRGESSSVIPSIRHNLSLIGDLNGCDESIDSNVLDDCLVRGIKRFQLRNGAKATGKVDKKTYNMLKRPLSSRIQSIRLNLDKMKRLRRKNRDVRMELNIPSFRLNFLDKDDLVDTIRVVVGKPSNPTPVFGNSVQYIVVNPWWKIPASIVKNEMLKHLIKDPYYYERQGKVMHKTWDPDSERLDPGNVNWAKYKNKKYIPYRFMQVPSNKNALGKIKFMFPNDFSVYIHDTPSKKLFFNNYRAYSHGCMRIQKPRELLKAFAMYNPNLDVDQIMEQLKTTRNSTLNLRKKIPIDITYLTAFVDAYGNLNFRKDVYGYDKLLLQGYSNAHVTKSHVRKTKKKAEHRKNRKKPVSKTESQIKNKKVAKKHSNKHVSKEDLKTSEIYQKR